MIKLTRPPCRILQPGTFPLPGSNGASYTIGHEAVMGFNWNGLPDQISVDIEGAGKDGRKKYDLKSVQIGTVNHALVLDPRVKEQFGRIRQIINSGRTLTFHNSPFDVPNLYLTGMLDLDTVWNIEDTLIWARGAEPDERTRKNLLSTSNRYLGTDIKDPLDKLLKTLGWSKAKWYEDGDLNIPAYRIMAASDAIATARIRDLARQAFYDRLTTGHPFSKNGVMGDEAWRLVDREQVTNRMHVHRQCKGYLADPEYLDAFRANQAKDIHVMAARLEAEGVKPGDTGSMAKYLDENGLLPEKYPRTPKTGKPSGAKENLARLGHPLVKVFNTHKELVHVDRDYMSKVMHNADDDGRIHPGTNILGAATGRQSISGDAPLHQFSGDSRGILLADNWEEALKSLTGPDGNRLHAPKEPCTCTNPKGLVSIDWAQIEPVLAANVAGDTAAIEHYESGHKFYDALTALGGIPYKVAKTSLLAQLYGEGIMKLARDLEMSMDQAKEVVAEIWKVLPGTKALVDKPWKGGKLQSIAEKYEMVFTLSGRIVPVPSGFWPCWECEGTGYLPADAEPGQPTIQCFKCSGKGKQWKVATHKGVNYFVQGGAYDLLAEAEYSLWESGLWEALYFSMHDEMIVDAAAAHDVRKIMATPPERLCMLAKRTPVLRTDMAHLGERWADA
jgi:DNA polymerase-1